jgi:hypothetical protein
MLLSDESGTFNSMGIGVHPQPTRNKTRHGMERLPSIVCKNPFSEAMGGGGTTLVPTPPNGTKLRKAWKNKHFHAPRSLLQRLKERIAGGKSVSTLLEETGKGINPGLIGWYGIGTESRVGEQSRLSIGFSRKYENRWIQE